MLEATLRSVRAQTYPKIEHIVVDGRSTDGTVDLLRRYADTYAMRWLSEPDGGMYPAINKGFRMARGDIQAYLNDDDLYFPWAVETIVDAFARRPHADVIYGDTMEINNSTLDARLAWNLPFDLDYLRLAGFMWQPAVFWRREALHSISGFDEQITFGADLDAWLRMGAQGRHFFQVHEMLAVVRVHEGTISLARRQEVVAELEGIREAHRPRGLRGSSWRRLLDKTRRPVWARIYWLELIVQSLVPKHFRRGPWRRFLSEGGTRISYLSVILRPIPGLGRKVAGPMLRPGRNWLYPPE